MGLSAAAVDPVHVMGYLHIDTQEAPLCAPISPGKHNLQLAIAHKGQQRVPERKFMVTVRLRVRFMVRLWGIMLLFRGMYDGRADWV